MGISCIEDGEWILFFVFFGAGVRERRVVIAVARKWGKSFFYIFLFEVRLGGCVATTQTCFGRGEGVLVCQPALR
jgi:hypothetical protein